MSEYNDPQKMLVDGLRADMPPVAAEDALRRVKARALGAPPAAHTSLMWLRSWRAAASFAAVAAVIAAALAFAPGQQSAAFARDKAAEALLFQTPGRVLHVEATYTESWKGAGEARDLDQRWSTWVDSDGDRIREEFVNRADGSRSELRIRANDRLTVLLSSADDGTVRLFDQDMSTRPVATTMDDMVGYMRARIADGSAKVTGMRLVDGEEYWVVEWESDEGDIAITVTMRTSDYRPKTWMQDVVVEGGAGPSGTQEERVTFETVEQLDPGSLPGDFFSRDAVLQAAKPGTPVEAR